jgi:hypothetical protein
MQPRHRRQRDLFEEDRKALDIPAAQRSVLVRLIEVLLVEALAGSRGEPSLATAQTRGATHEQDHA